MFLVDDRFSRLGGFMATRVLRLSFAVSIIAFLIALAGCGSNKSVICPLAATSSAQGCGCGVPSTPCPAPEFLVADGTDGHIWVYPVSGGTLGSPTSVSGPAMSLGMALLDNGFVYASSFSTTGTSSLSGWSLNFGTSALSPISGSPYSLGPLSVGAGVATASTPQAVYVADAGRIDAFKADSMGALTPIAGSPFTSGTNLFITVDPQSKFLFASEDDPPGSIGAFTIDQSSGALTQVAGSPFPAVPPEMTSTQPGQIVVDFSGKFVYATLTSNAQIVGFSIDPSSGALTVIPGSPFNADVLPAGMAAAHNFLYVSANGNIIGFSIDPTAGTLTRLAGAPVAAHSVALTTDFSGSFLFAASGGAILTFQIDSTTGALTQISSTPSAGATVLAFVQ
jgi:6-phosphogluconolactonase